jgi:hypothetical protein
MRRKRGRFSVVEWRGLVARPRRGTAPDVRRSVRAAGVIALSVGILGCPATKRMRAPGAMSQEPGSLALLVEQHEFGGSQVTIRRIDGAALSAPSIWRGTHWEVELPPGRHVVEVSYRGSDSYSTTNAAVPFAAEAGGRYEVRATRLKEGFASELGKHLAATFWPAVKSGWIAWVVDTRTGAVVGGVEPTQSMFKSTVEAGGKR